MNTKQWVGRHHRHPLHSNCTVAKLGLSTTNGRVRFPVSAVRSVGLKGQCLRGQSYPAVSFLIAATK